MTDFPAETDYPIDEDPEPDSPRFFPESILSSLLEAKDLLPAEHQKEILRHYQSDLSSLGVSSFPDPKNGWYYFGDWGWTHPHQLALAHKSFFDYIEFHLRREISHPKLLSPEWQRRADQRKEFKEWCKNNTPSNQTSINEKPEMSDFRVRLVGDAVYACSETFNDEDLVVKHLNINDEQKDVVWHQAFPKKDAVYYCSSPKSDQDRLEWHEWPGVYVPSVYELQAAPKQKDGTIFWHLPRRKSVFIHAMRYKSGECYFVENDTVMRFAENPQLT